MIIERESLGDSDYLSLLMRRLSGVFWGKGKRVIGERGAAPYDSSPPRNNFRPGAHRTSISTDSTQDSRSLVTEPADIASHLERYLFTTFQPPERGSNGHRVMKGCCEYG